MTTQRLRRARRERMVGNRKIRMEGRGMVFAACYTEGKETMGWRGFILGCCCAAIGTLDLGSGIEEGWIGGYFWRRDMDGFCLEETGQEVELSGLVV